MAVIKGIQADLFPDLGNILYWWARDRYLGASNLLGGRG